MIAAIHIFGFDVGCGTNFPTKKCGSPKSHHSLSYSLKIQMTKKGESMFYNSKNQGDFKSHTCLSTKCAVRVQLERPPRIWLKTLCLELPFYFMPRTFLTIIFLPVEFPIPNHKQCEHVTTSAESSWAWRRKVTLPCPAQCT